MTTDPWSAVDAGTVPAKHARELRDAWERFVSDSAPIASEPVSAGGVRDQIVASWQRSRDAGVDPTGHLLAPDLLDGGDLRDRWQQHALAAAGPVLHECLWDTAASSDHLVVVADADGMLLSVEGDLRVRAKAADDMNFSAGALWSEAGAGTNAVGTALATGHAVQVFAAEHFTEPVQRWTCAAAPVREPEEGRVIGAIDLTGDFTVAHPHSLAVVIATARAVEAFLHRKMIELDDQLRVRYAHLLDQQGIRRALVSRSGRVLAGHPEHWEPGTRLFVPRAGGELMLPGGHRGLAEPTRDGEAFIVERTDYDRRRARRARLRLELLGNGSPAASVDGDAVPLRPRHAELLVLLAARPNTNAERLSVELYGDQGSPASVRVELSRLRKLLPGNVHAERYALIGEVDSDADRVRRALRAGDVVAAAAGYTGELLARSQAPGVVRERDELEGWLRDAVLTSDDAEALWSWTQSPSGDQDLMAWSRLLGLLAYDDPRRSRVAAHTRMLRAAAQPGL